MEPPIQITRSTSTAAPRTTSADAQAVAGKVTEAAHAVREHIEARGAEAIDQAKQQAAQAKQQVGEAYEQTRQRVSEQYEKAVDYGRDNPGLTTLLALGIGVGIGLLLGGGISTLRSRVSSE